MRGIERQSSRRRSEGALDTSNAVLIFRPKLEQLRIKTRSELIPSLHLLARRVPSVSRDHARVGRMSPEPI